MSTQFDFFDIEKNFCYSKKYCQTCGVDETLFWYLRYDVTEYLFRNDYSRWFIMIVNAVYDTKLIRSCFGTIAIKQQ